MKQQDRRVNQLETHQPNPVSYERQLAQLNSNLTKLTQKNLDDTQKRDDLSKRLGQLQAEIFNLYEKGIPNAPLEIGEQRPSVEQHPVGLDQNSAGSEPSPVVQTVPDDQSAFQREFEKAQKASDESEGSETGSTMSASAPNLDLAFEDVAQVYTQAEIDEQTPPKEENQGVVIPLGSVITGRLINGLDAPVSDAARRDPFPVTLVVKKEALLPNFHTADIRHCHINLSGYGDISTERIMLRTEGISCVTEDGFAVETSMKGYASGPDGKAGVRGRLVERQGQMIAKSLLGSTIGGFADAFGGVPIPVVSTDGASSDINYASQLTNAGVQNGLTRGISDSGNRIADFYIDWAEKIFPILELDAGREIDINVSSGFVLPIPTRL